jgi:hypothetical protein
MSKAINVNPDHYKMAGRERPSHARAKNEKALTAPTDRRQERWQKRQRAKSRSTK